MRPILFFADRLPPMTGGMEMHARYFIEHFQGHSRFPLMAVVTRDKDDRDCLLMDGHCVPTRLDTLRQQLPAVPSLVFFNSGRWIEDLSSIRTHFPNAIFVYRTGGNEINKAPLERLWLEDHAARQAVWVEQLNSNIDWLITNSAYTEARLLALGIRPERLKRCVGGVNLDALRRSNPMRERNPEPLFFCASRFVPYKNHALLITIFHALALRGLHYQLRLAGDGPLLEVIKAKVRELELSERVEFLGTLSNEEVCRELSRADYYLQLSAEYVTPVAGGSYVHAEGMGRSVLEALSCGVYVIASRSGALPEVVTPGRGLLVDPSDPSKMIDELSTLLRSPVVRPPPIDDYGWERYFALYEHLWEDVYATAACH